MPPKPDLVYPSLDDFVEVNESVSESIVEKPTVETNEPKNAKKENGAPIIKDWVFESEKEDVPKIKTVNTVKGARVNTARPKAVLSAVKGKKENAVKASACWVWRPKHKVLDHVSRNNGASMSFKRFDYINAQGRSKYMIGNKSYLTDYEEIGGGFVAFGDVYFVKELKFKLFSVSQMCDKKNSVLFTDTACVVLSPDFKLTDQSHVLLKVPRKDNMYNVDLKNVVPQGGLTCLFEKATPDESNLRYKRLRHVFFLATKDETSEILKTFITDIENLIDLRVKVRRCDNGTEFKNRVMNQLCEMKGIKREFSVARTLQQNRAEAINTACYVQNRVLVIKPHNKNPYEIFLGRKPALSFMRPFGCLVIILNTIDHLGKFDGKDDEGFFVGYSTNSKVFKVFNSRTIIVEENLHVQFSKNIPNIEESRPNWHFDIDALTKSMNYKPVVTGNQSNGNAGTKACNDAGKARVETVLGKDYILLPLWTQDPSFYSILKDSPAARFKPSEDTNNINTVSPIVNAAGIHDNSVDENIVYGCVDDPNMPGLEDIVYSDGDEDFGAEADINNLNAFMPVSPIPTTRIHKDHPVEQIIKDLNSAPQTRRMTKNLKEHSLFSSVQQRTNHKDFQNCLFACFLSQEEPKKVWTLMDLPNGKRAIGTKWVYMNKKDERGIVIKNKKGLVTQGYTQEEGIYYDEVFAPVARIEAIRLFLADASFKDFVVYQIDVKSDFLYDKIEEEVYVFQRPGSEDPDFPDKVYKVENALYGLHQAPRAWYETLSTYLSDNGLQRGKIDKTLFIRRDKGDILLVQVYVDDIIFDSTKKLLCTDFEEMMHKKFQMSSVGEFTFFLGLDVKTASTPMETHKPFLKDADGEDVDEHLYRSMIGSLMYLTSLRLDIMFAICQPKLGLWYPKDSPFDLVAYTNSDYAGASLDRKSTTGAEYIAASNCYGQFWDTVKVKTVNGEVQLQALVDKNKVIITESIIRRDLQLEDAEGTDCLPNATIFEQLTHMGAKTNAWNKFSSTMASAIICLATNQNFNFSKYIFDNMVKYVDSMRKQKSRKSKKKNTEVPQPSSSTGDVPDENVPTTSNDPLLSGEDRLKLTELMDLCTNLQKKVLDLDKAKTT
ncbi:putative ribonuclease H-like domain-containing protein [Tanacetum coccineum]